MRWSQLAVGWVDFDRVPDTHGGLLMWQFICAGLFYTRQLWRAFGAAFANLDAKH
jgi:hypothetical protein